MRKFVYIALILVFSSCGEDEQPAKKGPMDWDAHKSSEFNRGLADREKRDIKLFLEMRPEWQMKETGSGLRIWIYEHGTGAMPMPEEFAEIEYEITLLNGDFCYKTEEDEYEEVRVDHSDVESGVQEAMKLMRVGDRAKLILPSHLGHGLLGDLDKIPPLKSLVIDLKLIGIKK